MPVAEDGRFHIEIPVSFALLTPRDTFTMKYQSRFTAIILLIVVIGSVFLSSLLTEEKSPSSGFSSTAPRDYKQTEQKVDPSAQSTATAGDANNRVFACNAPTEWDFTDLVDVAAFLSVSEDPEHILMAALFGTDRNSESRIDAMTKAMQAAPDDRLIIWNFLDSCAALPNAAICRDQYVENRAIEVDGNNGQLWARISGFRFKRGEVNAALDALRKASTAPDFKEYWIEHVGLFVRGLAAANSAPYRDRIVQAIGMAAAMVSDINLVIDACDTNAVESAEWLHSCVQFGERMELDGHTFLSKSVGLRIQQKMYSISGDKDKEVAAEDRLELVSESYSAGLSEDEQVLLWRRLYT